MADFVRFKGQSGPILVNMDSVSVVIGTEDGGEEATCIGFAGDRGDYIVVNEPFEDVAAKLNRLF